MTEKLLQIQVCDYLRWKYPSAKYRVDFAAGLRMTIGQAVQMKRLQSRAYPDLFIAEPRGCYHGMFLELKIKFPYKKNGELKTDAHIQEQAEMLEALRQCGYVAEFASSFDMAKAYIDTYMMGMVGYDAKNTRN